jgi:hypothetical protein
MAPDTEPTDEELAMVMREARDLAIQRRAKADAWIAAKLKEATLFCASPFPAAHQALALALRLWPKRSWHALGTWHRLLDIAAYTADRWGDAQAERYLTGLYSGFQTIVDRPDLRRPFAEIPPYFRALVGKHAVF